MEGRKCLLAMNSNDAAIKSTLAYSIDQLMVRHVCV